MLASNPASMVNQNRTDLGIPNRFNLSTSRSSGTDWTDRTKRLAARAPGLDIFSQALVLRDTDGWQITDAGRTLLASIETRVPTTPESEQAREVVVEPALPAQQPMRRLRTDRRARPSLTRRRRISAVA